MMIVTLNETLVTFLITKSITQAVLYFERDKKVILKSFFPDQKVYRQRDKSNFNDHDFILCRV